MSSIKEQETHQDGRLSALDEMRKTGIVHAPTVAEVDVASLLVNLDVFRATDAEVMAVVKADAYGHGAVRVARVLADAGIRQFAVGTVPEGVELRRAGIAGRILILGAPLPEYLGRYVRHELDVTVPSLGVAEAVREATGRGRGLRAHVKVDTGMGRIGLLPKEAADVVRLLEGASGVELAGLWTHLATADEPELEYSQRQLELFHGVVREVGDAFETIHAANSAAALRLPESLVFDRPLIRAGIGLYGYTALEGLAQEAGLKPVMRLTSRVTHVKWVEPGTTVSYGRRWRAERRTRIATVNAGYGDGYPRLATNRAKVGIAGEHYPVAGTVCMDMFMVDVGDRTDVAAGDEVVLFGPGGPDAFDLAVCTETIPYEILTRVTRRVPRAYVEGRGRQPVRS